MNLDHIVILLADIDNTIKFYHQLLPLIGFEQKKNTLFSNSQDIYLDFRAAQEPQHSYRRYAPGLNHMGFTAPSRDSLTKIQRDMRKAGFEVGEIQEFDDGAALFLKDAEGMRVEVSCYI